MESALWYAIGVAVFFGLMFLIAHYGWKRTKDVKDYYIAGGRLSSWIMAFSYQATNVSAAAMIGAVGLVWFCGLAPEIWITLAFIVGMGLAFVFILPRLRRWSEKVGAITLPEFFGKRFNSSAVRYVSTILIILFLLPLLIAQFKASGFLLQATMGIDYDLAIIIFGVVIALYVAHGGFFGVAYTDFIQGWLIIFACLLVPITLIHAAGGWTAANLQYAAIVPGGVGIWGTWGPLACIGAFVSILFGCLCIPHTAIRFLSIKRGEERKSFAISMGIYALMIPLACFAGTAARILYPGVPSPDYAIPEAIAGFPVAIGTILLAAFLAGIMSTIDSIVLVGSSSFARDIYQDGINPSASLRRMMWVSRIVSFLVGLIAIIIALRPPALIITLMLWSWGLFAVTYAVTLVGGLYWKRMNKWSALTALILGGALVGLWTELGKPWGIHPVIFSLAVTVPITIIVALLTRPPEKSVIKTFFG